MTHDELKNMADRIKKRRKSIGYTQESFAEVIGISYSSYARIENAFQKPSLDTVIKIAKHLSVSIDHVVLGESSNSANEVTDLEKVTALLEFADKEQVKHTIDVLNKLIKV